MNESHRRPTGRNIRPAEHRDVLVIANRVVQLQTQHMGESVWIASGRVSEPLPSGPRLQPPVEVSATGPSEQAAIQALRHRIEELHSDTSD